MKTRKLKLFLKLVNGINKGAQVNVETIDDHCHLIASPKSTFIRLTDTDNNYNEKIEVSVNLPTIKDVATGTDIRFETDHVTVDGINMPLLTESLNTGMIIPVPNVDICTLFTIDKSELPHMEYASKMLSTDQSKTAMQSFAFIHNDGQLQQIVTTDGHRLTRIGESSNGETTLLRPGVSKMLPALMKAFGPITIGHGNGKTVVSFSNELVIQFPEVLDTFPPYNQVFPRENIQWYNIPTTAKVAIQKLEKLVKTKPSEPTAIEFNASNGKLKLIKKGSSIEVDFDGLFRFGANSKYMLEAISKAESFELGFVDALSPIWIRPDGYDNVDTLVMPVRLD